MSSKTVKRIGWSLSILLALLFVFSASLKLFQTETTITQAAAVGLSPGQYLRIGIIEIVAVVLFLIPRTGVLGTLFLIAYMGGAIVTHLEHNQPIAMALVIQSLIWLAAAMRFPELWQRLYRTKQATIGNS